MSKTINNLVPVFDCEREYEPPQQDVLSREESAKIIEGYDIAVQKEIEQAQKNEPRARLYAIPMLNI
jgi:hypothetical protein